ncbi:MAG: VWA domain-containing protein [Thermoanaerobaculia bacterium]
MRAAYWIVCLVSLAAGSVSAGSIAVTITSPTGDHAVFDRVEVAADILADEPLERVEFFLNGRRFATATQPPYRVWVEVGEENLPRHFTVIAIGSSGTRVGAAVSTPAVEIDLVVDAPLQQLYVTASREDRPVLDLGRTDFQVFDNGVEQEIVTFEHGDVPMTIAMLVDVSESMRGEQLQVALDAARGFLSRLTPLDEALVMTFSDRTHRVTTSSSEIGGLAAALENLQSGGGTSLNDHLYLALRLLDRRQGRPVIIVLSDGADTLSFLTMEEVLWKAHRSNAVIYRIHLHPSGIRSVPLATSWRSTESHADEVGGLEAAVADSGGRVTALARLEELEQALDDVLQELRQQYVVGYYPTDPRDNGTWRPVRVEVSAPGIDIRTRAGYVD